MSLDACTSESNIGEKILIFRSGAGQSPAAPSSRCGLENANSVEAITHVYFLPDFVML